MNKILTASAIALLIGGAACSNEEMMNPSNGGDGNVSFSVTIPAKSFSTRAFGDGYTANKLEYAVYDKDANNTFVSNGETTFSEEPEGSLTTTVNINLANGRDYNIVFFASPESGDVYSLNTATGDVTVDYSKMTAYNSTDYDCFSTVYNTGKVTGPINENVTLYRPVAQVNWGTSDLKDGTVSGENGVYGDGAADLYTAVSVKGVNNVLNILTGQRSNSADFDGNVTFSNAARPSGETFPVEPATYQYLSMQYLLVPEESSVVDLELTAYAGQTSTEAKSTVTVTNAPVQANYRTNIYGALLTNPANLNIEKDPNFNDPSYDILYEWDGSVADVPEADDNNVIAISTPAQLAGVAAEVNKNANVYNGKTIKLTQDISLSNLDWTPIGDIASNSHFSGTFDGDNHTISNLNVSNSEGAGLFGALQGKVQNLKLENVTLTSNHYAGAVAGYCTDNAGTSLTNIEVDNATVILTPEVSGNTYNNGDKAGGLIGYIAVSNPISNCKVTNSYIKGYRDVGGLCGMSDNRPENCIVENTTIEIDGTNGYEDERQTTIGELVGRGTGANVSNTGTGNTLIFSNQTDGTHIQYNVAASKTVKFKNCSTKSFYITANANSNITLEDCVVTAPETKPEGNSSDRFGIMINSAGDGYTVDFINTTINGSWSHGIYVQGGGKAGNVNVNGCSFSDWGKKETEAADIATSACVKIYNVAGITQSEADRAAYQAQFFANGNKWDASHVENGYTVLNLTDQTADNGNKEYTYTSAE